jgi:hypothetical protein
VEPKAATPGQVSSAIKPVKRAAAFTAVAHFVGFGSFTTVLLGLTPQALCCRAAPQAQIGAFKTGSLIIVISFVDGPKSLSE